MKYIICFLSSRLILSCTKSPEPEPEPQPVPILSITPTSISLGASKGSVDSIQLTHLASWTVTLDPSSATWLKLSVTSGTGNAKIYITAEENNNTTLTRTANLTVRSSNTQVSPQTVQVSQKNLELNGFHSLFGGSDHEVFTDFIAVSDGYVAVGNANSTDGDVVNQKGRGDLWIVKTDKAGKKIWQKTYGGSELDYGYGIVRANDGNGYVVVGRTISKDGDVKVNKGLGDVWVLKVDNNGILLWEKTFGGTSDDRGVAITAIKEGGYLIGADSDSRDGDLIGVDPLFHITVSLVIKIDEGGNKIWASTLIDSKQASLGSIVQSKDGGFVGVGTVRIGLSDSYMRAFKLDGSGVLKWNQIYQSTLLDGVPNGLVAVDNDTYIIAGSRNSGYPGSATGGIGGDDGFIANISSDGSLLWRKLYGGNGEDRFEGVTMSGSDIIAVGFTVPFGALTSKENGWMVKVNSAGSLLSDRQFGGTLRDRILEVKKDPQGFIVATGLSFSNDGDVSGQKGLTDAWIFAVKE